MGLVARDPSCLQVVAYCDSCDGVLLPRGRRAPSHAGTSLALERPPALFRTSRVSDLQELARPRDEVAVMAQDAGWVATPDGRWRCDRCRDRSTPGPGPTGRMLAGATVLVAEDHDDSRELLCAYLDQFGAQCVPVASGLEAFEAFTRRRPHVLLSDMWMPDIDGLELVRRIRALPDVQARLTPCIALSGMANEEQVIMAGFHALILKPYDPEHVAGVVAEFLGKGRASAATCTWAIDTSGPGSVRMTFSGYVTAADARTAMRALGEALENGPCALVCDLRQVTGFSPAGASVAQREVWPKRSALRHVRILGGPLPARIVASAACRFLGLGCTVD
jgi:CheY-like chemotaxis protein